VLLATADASAAFKVVKAKAKPVYLIYQMDSDNMDSDAPGIRVDLSGTIYADSLIVDGPRTVQYAGRSKRDGFDHALRYRGLRCDSVLMSPLEHELRKHMLPPSKGAESGPLKCPIPGVLLSYAVRVGDAVEAGDAVATVEAMKMANVICAERPGVVAKLRREVGATLAADDALVDFEEAPPPKSPK